MLNSGIDYNYDELLAKVAEFYHCNVNEIYNINEHNSDLLQVEFLAPNGIYKELVSKYDILKK